MKICIFPGTFNPIHQAHLNLAEYALKEYNFDKIIFIPAYLPPHKSIDTKLANHRYQMVKIATNYNPQFEVSDIEYKSQNKSYSLITVKKIIQEYKIKGKLNFLIGTDAFEKIETWYKVDELKKLVHFIVFDRGIQLSEKIGFDYEIANLNFLDISSTNIRNNCYNNIQSVEDYIRKNELYNRKY